MQRTIIAHAKLQSAEELADYGNNESLEEKLDDANYTLTERKKEGLALARAMLNRITKSTLLAAVDQPNNFIANL